MSGDIHKKKRIVEDDPDFLIPFFEGILRREPKYVEVLERLAHLYTKVGDYDQGLKADRKLVRLRPDDRMAHYNLACSLALKRRFADALRSLQNAVELGYDDWGWLRRDPDLRELRKRTAFREWFTTVVTK